MFWLKTFIIYFFVVTVSSSLSIYPVDVYKTSREVQKNIHACVCVMISFSVVRAIIIKTMIFLSDMCLSIYLIFFITFHKVMMNTKDEMETETYFGGIFTRAFSLGYFSFNIHHNLIWMIYCYLYCVFIIILLLFLSYVWWCFDNIICIYTQ